MKLDLQLRLRQTIAPQLIQSLKMLQMPILRLEQLVRQELSVNPMLEEVDTAEEPETSTPESSEDNQDPQLDKIDWPIDHGNIKIQIRNRKATLITVERTVKMD